MLLHYVTIHSSLPNKYFHTLTYAGPCPTLLRSVLYGRCNSTRSIPHSHFLHSSPTRCSTLTHVTHSVTLGPTQSHIPQMLHVSGGVIVEWKHSISAGTLRAMTRVLHPVCVKCLLPPWTSQILAPCTPGLAHSRPSRYRTGVPRSTTPGTIFSQATQLSSAKRDNSHRSCPPIPFNCHRPTQFVTILF